MRAEREILLAIAATFSFALFAGAAESDGNGDDRIFQRVQDIRSGEAVVYIYRRRSGAGAIERIGFDVNDDVTGALWAGRYQAVAVPAGTVKVRVRGVATTSFKCTVMIETGGTTRSQITKETVLPYLGVYGGSKWETTFQTEAGKEYFVEVAGGLRANLQTEEAAKKHKLTTLKRTKREYVFFSKSMAEEAVRKGKKECSENRLTDSIQVGSGTSGVRVVD